MYSYFSIMSIVALRLELKCMVDVYLHILVYCSGDVLENIRFLCLKLPQCFMNPQQGAVYTYERREKMFSRRRKFAGILLFWRFCAVLIRINLPHSKRTLT